MEKMDSLADDELQLIALKTDYDDLSNWGKVNRQFFTLINSPIFWINKIEHDFVLSINLADSKQLRKIYRQNAVKQYLLLKTSRASYNTYKDFYLLLVNNGLMGKSLLDSMGKVRESVTVGHYYNVFFDSQELYGIGYSITHQIFNQYQDKGKIIGSLLIDNQDYLTRIHKPEGAWKKLSGIAAAIYGKFTITDLPSDKKDILQYAILFDNISLMEKLLTTNPQLKEKVLLIAAAIGNEECIQLAYDHGARLTTDALVNAISYHNVYVIDKLVKLGAIITRKICLAAINNKNIDIIKKLLTPEQALYHGD